MEPRELNRMFDRLAPTEEQEREGLDRLLHEERKVTPMRKLKKLTAVGIAAALMVITCAAAVVTGFDQQLAEYFRVRPEQLGELVYGTVSEENRHTYGNGWTVEVKQATADSWALHVLVEITAPEGTVLGPESRFEGRIILPEDLDQEIGVAGSTTLLEDGDPGDACVTMLWRFLRDRSEPSYLGQTVYVKPGYFHAEGGEAPETAGIKMYWEPWRCSITLPEQDPGISRSIGQSFCISDVEVTLTEIYLSPLSFIFQLEEGPDPLFVLEDGCRFDENDMDIRERWEDEIFLTMADGKRVYMAEFIRGGASQAGDAKQKGSYLFQLPGLTDPEQVISVTLFGQTYELK